VCQAASKAIFAEAYRLLRPGGCLSIMEVRALEIALKLANFCFVEHQGRAFNQHVVARLHLSIWSKMDPCFALLACILDTK